MQRSSRSQIVHGIYELWLQKQHGAKKVCSCVLNKLAHVFGWSLKSMQSPRKVARPCVMH